MGLCSVPERERRERTAKGAKSLRKVGRHQVAGYILNPFKGIGVTLVGTLGTEVESDRIVIAVRPSPEN